MPASLTALIVDDEKDMCLALESLLQREDFQTVSALTAEDALSHVKEKNFDVVFLDIILPDMDGIKLVETIKLERPSLPIVVISGYHYEDDPIIQKAISDGLIRGFIEKPFDVQDIRREARKATSTPLS